MNQSIHFPDREEWHETEQAICFPALANGLNLTCAIHAATLQARFGEGEAMVLFRHHRWDLEEEAEARIRQQQEDAQGWVWLS
ncbi:DUF1488 domain-containing protein [[Erwinia] mediterraneensis]|uniref:DUF1488 domain-containing protein n=1 Tax=[Erwinia] mediterraneensis TaxID=2161819 RepID=UPI0010304206|nr:DUF1488 domain-containing protein [[Erwinia] mediterraneensis]